MNLNWKQLFNKVVNNKLIFSLILIFLLGLFLKVGNIQAQQNDNISVYSVRVFAFHSKTCPHCRAEDKFLKKIAKDFPNLEIHRVELTEGFKAQSLFSQASEQYDKSKFVGIPVLIIGDEIIDGFGTEKTTGKLIEKKIKECSQVKCPSKMDKLFGLTPLGDNKIIIKKELASTDKVIEEKGEKNNKLMLFGKSINLEKKSIIFLGIILGLADGINPCMFSVLIFLLTYLLAVGSRKKAFKSGLIFVLTTFGLYFVFMLGIIKITDIFKISNAIRYLVIAFSFFAGLIMLKDFFFYGRWFSLEIDDRFKGKIEKLIKRGTIPSAFLLALFSGLVELPCTAGIPLAYTTILTKRALLPYGPLIWYNLFYTLPSLLIVLAVALAWSKVEKIEEKRLIFRKWMRLIAGLLLIILAFSLLFNWL